MIHNKYMQPEAVLGTESEKKGTTKQEKAVVVANAAWPHMRLKPGWKCCKQAD